MYPKIEECEKRLHMIEIQEKAISKSVEHAKLILKGFDEEKVFLNWLINNHKTKSLGDGVNQDKQQ